MYLIVAGKISIAFLTETTHRRPTIKPHQPNSYTSRGHLLNALTLKAFASLTGGFIYLVFSFTCFKLWFTSVSVVLGIHGRETTNLSPRLIAMDTGSKNPEREHLHVSSQAKWMKLSINATPPIFTESPCQSRSVLWRPAWLISPKWLRALWNMP